MTQEDKKLLLQDLCARLPYGVKFPYHMEEDCNHRECDCVAVIDSISEDRVEFTYEDNGYPIDWSCSLSQVKPYIRPMSSMTEEEYVYFMSIRGMNLRSYEIQEMMSENFSHPNRIAIVNTLGRYSHNIDWLNENMFDYRGLIERGLATEAPEGMYKIN